MVKQKTNFKFITYLTIAMFALLGFLFSQGANLNVSAVASPAAEPSAVEYTDVSDLSTLTSAIEQGTTNFRVTGTISVVDDLQLEGLTFKVDQQDSRTADYFTVAEDKLLTFKNCTIVGEGGWSYSFTNSGHAFDDLTVESEHKIGYSFVSGKGDVTFENSTIKDVVSDNTREDGSDKTGFIHVGGTAENKAKVTFVSTTVDNCAFGLKFVIGSYVDVDFGQENSGLPATEIKNSYGQKNRENANGSFFEISNGVVNVYSLKMHDNISLGNGLIAVLFGSELNLFDGCEITNNHAYPCKGATHATMLHIYHGSTFNMLGGKITNNFVDLAVIGNNDDSGKSVFNIQAGYIGDNTLTYEDVGVFLVDNVDVNIGKDMHIKGDINTWGVVYTNKGLIEGNVFVAEHDFTGKNAPPKLNRMRFINQGKIIGNVNIKQGNLENSGEIVGDVDVQDVVALTPSEPAAAANVSKVLAEVEQQISIPTLRNGGSIKGDIVVYGGAVENKTEGKINGGITVQNGEVENVGKVEGYVTVKAGEVTNSGAITGEVFVKDGSVSNSGAITGEVTVRGGEVTNTNTGSIEGNLTAESGSFTNEGEIKGDLQVSEEATVVNEGKIVGTVKGEVSGSGKIEKAKVEKSVNGYKIAFWVMVVLFILSACSVALALLNVKKKNN